MATLDTLLKTIHQNLVELGHSWYDTNEFIYDGEKIIYDGSGNYDLRIKAFPGPGQLYDEIEIKSSNMAFTINFKSSELNLEDEKEIEKVCSLCFSMMFCADPHKQFAGYSYNIEEADTLFRKYRRQKEQESIEKDKVRDLIDKLNSAYKSKTGLEGSFEIADKTGKREWGDNLRESNYIRNSELDLENKRIFVNQNQWFLTEDGWLLCQGIFSSNSTDFLIKSLIEIG